MLLLNSLHVRSHRAAAQRLEWPGLSKHQRRLKIKAGVIRGSLFVFLAALVSVLVVLIGFNTAAAQGRYQKSNPLPVRKGAGTVPPRGGDGEQHTTYTVLVGAENVAQGATVNAYFPTTLRIHVGDTVHWQRNANEGHTVTFLAGTPLPPVNVPTPPGLPSPKMRNPLLAFPAAPANRRYDGTTYANSGFFGTDPMIYQVQSFDLTFTKPGTYNSSAPSMASRCQARSSWSIAARMSLPHSRSMSKRGARLPRRWRRSRRLSPRPMRRCRGRR